MSAERSGLILRKEETGEIVLPASIGELSALECEVAVSPWFDLEVVPGSTTVIQSWPAMHLTRGLAVGRFTFDREVSESLCLVGNR